MNVRLAWIVCAFAVAAGLACIAVAWPTWSGMNHTTGTVAALADATLHGESPGHAGPDAHLDALYLPVFPVGVGLLRRAGLDWLPALRTASLLSWLLLLAATGWAAHRVHGGRAAAPLAMALVACAGPVHVASLSGRADLLAAAASVAALAAWTSDRPGPRRESGWLAAGFAALALLTRATSLMLPLAVVARALIERDARPALRFALQFAVALGALLLLLLPVHGPEWFAAVFQQMWLAPVNTMHALRGPLELVRYLGSYAELTVIAVLAAVSLRGAPDDRHTMTHVQRDEPSLARIPFAMRLAVHTAGRAIELRTAAIASLALALIVLANRGSDHNHLVELLAIGAIAAVGLGERLEGDARRVFAGFVLVAVVSASWRDVAAERRHAADPMNQRAGIQALVRAEQGEVLSEDPMLSVACGRRPAFADPASVRAVARAGYTGARALEEDALRARWSLLVSELPIDPASTWSRDFHLGEGLARAIATRYERVDTIDGYIVWRPKRGLTPRAGR